MASTRRVNPEVSGRQWPFIGVGFTAIAGVVVVLLGLRSPPQMGTDQRVFHSVDALYTAVRSRDETRLTLSAERLHAQREMGLLPASAAEYLDGVISATRAGRWQSATESLYDFMLAQRREGAIVPERHPHGNARTKAARKAKT